MAYINSVAPTWGSNGIKCTSYYAWDRHETPVVHLTPRERGGEHCFHSHSWMEGALESAEHAVELLLNKAT